MNFFDQQALKHRQSFVLLGCFLLTMIAMGVVVQAIVVGMSRLLGEQSSFMQPSAPALALIALVWLMVIAGGFFRYLDVRGGGGVLARRFGAVHASNRARFDKEQRLLNVVAEMAIASSTPQPDVFVLRAESSINAFVLGAENARHVIVVTQGALDAFERPELQAVIAHEFGHIKNGDLHINMRLLVALGGLMAIDEVGQLLIGDTAVSRSREDPIFFHPGVIVGYLLRIIGSIGVFSGQLIRSAFSRQREYLADATAAQFTRNPIALACALDIIRQRQDEPALHGLHAQELAHLCFQTGSATTWYQRLIASHPSIQSRIDIIEPHFTVKRRQLERSAETSVDNAVRRYEAGAGVAVSAQASSVSDSGDRKVIVQEVRQGALSDRILLLLPDESSCLAVLFALFVSNDTNQRSTYYQDLSCSFNDRFMEQVKDIAEHLCEELRTESLGLINHATGVLSNSLEYETRQRIMRKLEQLLTANDEYGLMRYATLQLIRRKLGVESPVIKSLMEKHSSVAQASHIKSFDAMGNEFALLLSLIVETSGASPDVLDTEFERVLKCYTQTRYPRRTARETGIIAELEAAFQTLYVQPRPIRQAFVQHCLEIVEHDGYIARAERTLLDLFAASLDCDERAA